MFQNFPETEKHEHTCVFMLNMVNENISVAVHQLKLYDGENVELKSESESQTDRNQFQWRCFLWKETSFHLT